jgi:hypothetical protein
MSFYTMYALCAVITCCYVAIDLSENTNDYSQYKARDKLFAISILGLFWPVLFVGVVVGFLYSAIKSLNGGVK